MRDSEELVRLIHNAMLAAGIDGEAVYRRLGCDAKLFENIGRRCPHDYQVAFWTAVEDVTGDNEVSLRFCSHLPIFRGEALEYLLLSSPTLRDGIQVASRYRRLISDAIRLDIVESNQGTRLVVQGAGYDAPQARHTELCFAFGVTHVLRSVTSGHFAPVKVCLALDARRPAQEYEYIFNCPVEFNSQANEIWLDPELLQRSSPHHNPKMLRLFQQMADQQLAVIHQQDMIDAVRKRLFDRCSHQDSANDCTVADIATDLDMSARALREKLSNAGTTFRDLLKNTRLGIARRLLINDAASIEEVADIVGFSEPTAFYRAFRKWTGQTPGAYQKKHSVRR